MKQIYTIGIMIVFSGIIWSVQFHNNYQKPEPDKALKKTPQGSDLTPERKQFASGRVSLEPMWERSLFAAYRGETASSETTPKASTPSSRAVSMELIGVCKFGSFSGATILDKTPVRRKPGQPVKKSGAVFYRQGESLPSGYVLKSVTKDTATLVRGSSELVLELDFGNDASKNRNKQEVASQKKVLDNEAKRLAGEKEAAVVENSATPARALPTTPPPPPMNPTATKDEDSRSRRIRMLKSLRKRTTDLTNQVKRSTKIQKK